MRQVKIYIDSGAVLDLFNDEQINVTSTGKVLTDLGTSVADFSQTFTVPASTNNNIIFEHYYNNDLDGQIDHNLRRVSWIEIDDVPFRKGKLQLEKGEVKKGLPEFYTATFYGDAVTLKDKIGEDKLSVLNYTSLNHAYNETQVLNRVKGTTIDDVKYPLISSSRSWTNTGGGADDITTVGGSIKYTELFPAITLSKILSLIGTQYGITFGGSWLSSERFKKLSLWFKNKETFTFLSPPITLSNTNDVNFENGYIYGDVFYTYRAPSSITPPSGTVGAIFHSVNVNITTATTSTYILDVFKNGAYLTSLTSPSTGGNYTFPIVYFQPNSQSLNEKYTFKIRSTVSATFNGNMEYKINYFYTTGITIAPSSITYTNGIDAINTVVNLDVQSLAPDMKILDFLSGVLKYCNGVLTSPADNVYHIIPTNDFYNSGKSYNITQFVDEESITYARPPLYKSLNLKYNQSKSILNRAFYDLFAREFGDLTNSFDYDGGDYTIELPFENILQQKFTGTNLQVGYCFDQVQKNYIPSPVILAELPQQTSNVSYRFGASGTAQTMYVPFGQETIQGAIRYTSAFNLEVSSFYLTPNPNSLYDTYYREYLENLYNPKTRLVTLKTNLPLRILSDLKLNDILFIRDKGYIIVDQKSNLTTGDVDFTLLSWFEIVGFTQEYQINTVQPSFDVAYTVPQDADVSVIANNDSFTTLDDLVNEYGAITIPASFVETGMDTQNDYTFRVTVDGETVDYNLIFTRVD